jgi:putative membrane protein
MDAYKLALTLHTVSFTSWMAGMFYLPRLYAYHAGVPVGSEMDRQFQVMERRLLKIIINPAMIATFAFGIWLVLLTGYGKPSSGYWLHAKLALVLAMSGLHGFFAATRKRFLRGENTSSPKFYKIINELVTVLFIAIVALAVFKPF